MRRCGTRTPCTHVLANGYGNLQNSSSCPKNNLHPASQKKGLIIAIASVVVLGGAGGGYIAFAGKKQDKPAEAEHVEEVEAPGAVHWSLDPPLRRQFPAGTSARFLQVAERWMTRDPLVVTFLEHHNPIIRNDLLLLFGNKKVEEVASPEGKEALRAATLEAVRKIIAAEGGKPEALEAVYFTSFVMQ